MDLEELKTNFKYYSNFPNEGINFVDVGSIMQDGEEYNKIINLFIEKIESKFQFDKIVCARSRGFYLHVLLLTVKKRIING